jgi:hypothetical protein
MTHRTKQSRLPRLPIERVTTRISSHTHEITVPRHARNKLKHTAWASLGGISKIGWSCGGCKQIYFASAPRASLVCPTPAVEQTICPLLKGLGFWISPSGRLLTKPYTQKAACQDFENSQGGRLLVFNTLTVRILAPSTPGWIRRSILVFQREGVGA